MINCYIFTKPEYNIPDDVHPKLIWKGVIAALPPIDYEIAIDGILYKVLRASYDVTDNTAEIYLDYRDKRGNFPAIDF